MRVVSVVVLALVLGVGARTAPPPPPYVDGVLPEWVAPGGRLVVAGRAAAEIRLELYVGERVLASTVSGPGGRFRLEARAPRGGRHAVSVHGEDGTVIELGRLAVRALVLAAVGDVTFGDGVGSAIAAYGPRYPWLSVAPVLRAGDVAVANLEGVVSTRGEPWPNKEFHFRGPPAAVTAMASFAGVDVVSLANNHSVDFGRAALLDTILHASGAGLETVGGGRDLAAARRPAVLERGGLRIAFLGYSDVRPPGFDAGTGIPGAAPAFPHLIEADVRSVRRRADIVVVYYHWGIERSTQPSARQRALAEAAVNAGATIVLGAHPHVLQPITPIPGRRLVAWSLGNFVFAAHSPGTEETGILLVRLTDRGVLGHAFRPARIAGVQPQLR